MSSGEGCAEGRATKGWWTDLRGLKSKLQGDPTHCLWDEASYGSTGPDHPGPLPQPCPSSCSRHHPEEKDKPGELGQVFLEEGASSFCRVSPTSVPLGSWVLMHTQACGHQEGDTARPRAPREGTLPGLLTRHRRAVTVPDKCLKVSNWMTSMY